MIDEGEPTLVACERCGAECNPEDIVDGLCPECYAVDEDPPAGCEAEEP